MKAIVSTLAAYARRMPWVVVASTLTITAVLGSFAGQVEIASGNEGFAPESAEISAQERINDKFGREGSGSTIQVLVRAPEGDVISAEGLETALSVESTIRSSDVGAVLAESEQRPGVVHYLSGVVQAMQAQGLTVAEMTDELVKQLHTASLDADQAPPEQIAFMSRLVSTDFNPASTSATSGMVLAFVGSYPGDTAEESFNTQVETEARLADDLALVDSDLEIRPFSFGLLLTGVDDFTTEVGELFAMAFAVILVILASVYWLSPGRDG
ncbi:MAG TPA: hypothetical protein VK969_06920, partial [Acidimicrobiia bacterium]|nr:hypothetical protein [Acidimicrobiia bacterium]